MLTSCCCQQRCWKGNSPALLLLLVAALTLSGFLKAGYVNHMYDISLLRDLSLGVTYTVWWCWGAKGVTEWRWHGQPLASGTSSKLPVDNTLTAECVCFDHWLSYPSFPSSLKICTYLAAIFFSISERLSKRWGVFSGSQFQAWMFPAAAPNAGSDEELPSGDRWMEVLNHCRLGFWLHLWTIHRPRIICKNYSATHFK